MGSLPSPPHLLLSAHPWTSLPPPPVISPCPFSPFPSYCEVRIPCLRHLGLLPWKQGRIKAGARSSGIRPLRYLRSHLSRLPQGPGSQPQARVAHRSIGPGQGRGGPGGAPQPARTWEVREVDDAEARAAGGGARGLTAWSPALPGPWGPLPVRQPRGGAAGLPQRPRQLCSARLGARRPEGRGEVVGGGGGRAAVLKLSLAPAAHSPGTASAFQSLRSRQKESLRNRTSGARHQPSAAGCPEPIPGDHQSVVQGRCPHPGPTWEAGTRGE